MGMKGTPVYLAPEALNGLFSEASDVYAFGMTVWEMYTRHRAYDDLPEDEVSLPDLLERIVVQHLRPKVPEGCPLPLKSLIESCWAANPDDRPTFTELKNQLNVLVMEYITL